MCSNHSPAHAVLTVENAVKRLCFLHGFEVENGAEIGKWLRVDDGVHAVEVRRWRSDRET